MPTKGGFEQGYNAQAGVDDASHLIVEASRATTSRK